MKKYIKTTAKNAVKKGLVKVGDEIWVRCKVTKFYEHDDGFFNEIGQFFLNHTIRIPKPEPKPIDFSEAGRVLKYIYQGEDLMIVQTTGFTSGKTFAAFVLNPLKSDWKKGEVNMFSYGLPEAWQDITETYKP